MTEASKNPDEKHGVIVREWTAPGGVLIAYHLFDDEVAADAYLSSQQRSRDDARTVPQRKTVFTKETVDAVSTPARRTK